MPLYEYQCDSCGERFEAIQKFADTPLALHEKCGGPARRLLSVPALQFKGSGFYINDYAKSGSSSGGNGESKSESKNESKKKNESGDSSSGKEASGAKTESTASSTKSSDTPAPSTTSKPVSDKK